MPTDKRQPALLAVKPGAVTKEAKTYLRRCGVIVVETPEPDSVRFLTAEQRFDSDELAWVALKSFRAATYDTKEVLAECSRLLMEIFFRKMETTHPHLKEIAGIGGVK